VWRHLENAVKYEGTSFEEDVAPVPAVILDDMVRLGLDPEVEGDQGETTDPAGFITGRFMFS